MAKEIALGCDCGNRDTVSAPLRALPPCSLECGRTMFVTGMEFTCAAHRGKTDPPQDCDWPFCGCDPHADKVIAHLQECGMLVAGDGDTTPYNCFDPAHVPPPQSAIKNCAGATETDDGEWEDSTQPYPQRFRGDK